MHLLTPQTSYTNAQGVPSSVFYPAKTTASKHIFWNKFWWLALRGCLQAQTDQRNWSWPGKIKILTWLVVSDKNIFSPLSFFCLLTSGSVFSPCPYGIIVVCFTLLRAGVKQNLFVRLLVWFELFDQRFWGDWLAGGWQGKWPSRASRWWEIGFHL